LSNIYLNSVYLDASADLALAAKRLVWGKTLNSGQTCVAPDYIVCNESVRDKFIEAARQNYSDFFGGEAQERRRNKTYLSNIESAAGFTKSQHHFKRGGFTKS
jgi:aldehyde dehydrogenase (NAD+)